MLAWRFFLNFSEDLGILSLMFIKLVFLKKKRVIKNIKSAEFSLPHFEYDTWTVTPRFTSIMLS